MTLRQVSGVCVFLSFVAAIPTVGFGQERPIWTEVAGGPLTGPPVLDAPFSADATTTVRYTNGDGVLIERKGSARYYRDSEGRVRVEQTLMGVDALNAPADRQVRITIHPDPNNTMVYVLDPRTRTATPMSRGFAGLAIGGGNTFTVPIRIMQSLVFYRLQDSRTRTLWAPNDDALEEPLGSRRIEGVETVGGRFTINVPGGQFGNDGAIKAMNERWESPELKLVIYAHNSDPRTGVIEYRLTNIRRAQPAPDLFVVPPDYTIGSNPDSPSIVFELEADAALDARDGRPRK